MSQLMPPGKVSQKRRRVVSQKLQAAAKGAECMMHVINICNHNPETTVLAHSRIAERGLSRKADDTQAVNMCSACHDFYDSRTHQHISRSAKDQLFKSAHSDQLDWWDRKGLL